PLPRHLPANFAKGPAACATPTGKERDATAVATAKAKDLRLKDCSMNIGASVPQYQFPPVLGAPIVTDFQLIATPLPERPAERARGSKATLNLPLLRVGIRLSGVVPRRRRPRIEKEIYAVPQHIANGSIGLQHMLAGAFHHRRIERRPIEDTHRQSPGEFQRPVMRFWGQGYNDIEARVFEILEGTRAML